MSQALDEGQYASKMQRWTQVPSRLGVTSTVLALFVGACAPGGGGGAPGSGGRAADATGGASMGTGGGGPSGGASGTGGMAVTGGANGTAGSDGQAGSGGNASGGSGGRIGTGGSTGTGGAGAAGGAIGSGGSGSGGVSGGGRGGAGGAPTGGRGGGGGTGSGTGGNGGAAGGATGTVGPLVLSEDGGWCWFESPRALFQGTKLIVGSVASGWSTAARKGDIEVIVHDTATGITTASELHNQLELDDHDSPGLLARPDGRLLAMYAKHGSENHAYYRLSNANAPNSWGAEQTFTPTAATKLTYTNLFLLTAEQNRVYDFYRGLDDSYKPSYATSDDFGQTWKSGNVVINVPSTQKHRPYARYASNGTDTIHILYTEAHPRDFDNSLYHVYYKGGLLYRSNGTAVRALTQGLASPDEGTRIYQGGSQNVAWTVDVTLDASGYPHTVYSVQMGSAGLPTGEGGTDIRYRYARWDGTAWRDRALAYAGSRLYSGEDDYSGLAVLDPTNASVVYISTNADPVSGASLMSTADARRHYELFKGTTTNGGDTWQWTPLTSNSTRDNLRPILVTDGAGQKVLLWLRGTYRAYTDYQQQVMALFWRD